MKSDVGCERWQVAQTLELKDWEFGGIVENETEEIRIKYSLFLKNLSKRIFFKNSWKVLDVGCGPTCISRFFPKATKIGIDPLAVSLGLHGKMIAGVKIIQGRGEELPFGDKSFNLIICRNVIDHSQWPELVIKEVARVIKPRGFFVLSCYVYPGFIVLLKNLSERFGLLRNLEHPSSFTQEDLKNLSLPFFSIVEKEVIFEGKHSTDFGKVGTVGPDRSLVNKIIMSFNRLVGNKWFVREYLLLLKRL